MKYFNASDILPDELLKEVQKYAQGKALYIPTDSKRRKWGEGSGARSYYERRNEEIRKKYKNKGATVQQLANDYCLCVETIRKILYK